LLQTDECLRQASLVAQSVGIAEEAFERHGHRQAEGGAAANSRDGGAAGTQAEGRGRLERERVGVGERERIYWWKPTGVDTGTNP
jgi:hypothetical protein